MKYDHDKIADDFIKLCKEDKFDDAFKILGELLLADAHLVVTRILFNIIRKQMV